MVLHYIWCGFFLTAFLAGLVQWLVLGDADIFSRLIQSTFDSSKLGFELAIGLTGVMSLWLGIMKIGERAGMVDLLARGVGPVFHQLFPSLPKNHPVFGSMLMNISANLLGLDNAATPLGLKAMKELQELNPRPDTASDAQIMFLVLNSSGLTLIPVSILVYRTQLGAANPADVFLPILLATSVSTLVGLAVVCWIQGISLLRRPILVSLGVAGLMVGGGLFSLLRLPQEQMAEVSGLVGNLILFGVITVFILAALRRKVNVYESFLDGAKEGFHVAVTIIPYLIAILVAVGVFRTCGAMDGIFQGFRWILDSIGLDAAFVEALPTAFMKPFSGSGARGMMVDAMGTYGADSFVGRLACLFQGSTETTFYVIAVYYGAVAVRNTRYTVGCGLAADAAGVIAAVFLAYLFFGG